MQIHRNGLETVFGFSFLLSYSCNVFYANEWRTFGRMFGRLLYARIKQRLLLMSALSLPKPAALASHLAHLY